MGERLDLLEYICTLGNNEIERMDSRLQQVDRHCFPDFQFICCLSRTLCDGFFIVYNTCNHLMIISPFILYMRFFVPHFFMYEEIKTIFIPCPNLPFLLAYLQWQPDMLQHHQYTKNGKNKGLYCVTPNSHPANGQEDEIGLKSD